MPLKHKGNNEMQISRESLNQYGSLESMIRGIRKQRPLDLKAENWHRDNPDQSFEMWRELAKKCVLDGLHYDPGPVSLNAEITGREERDGFTLEYITFNTTPWNRVNGYFLIPHGVSAPVPGLVVFHALGWPDVIWERTGG